MAGIRQESANKTNKHTLLPSLYRHLVQRRLIQVLPFFFFFFFFPGSVKKFERISFPF